MAKILIVDDEESICWGLSQLCSQLGHDSFSASSAEQAMEFKDPLSIDLVISDVRLPGIDGIGAIGQYKKVFGPIPVITITAFGDLKTAIDAIQRGAFEYIVKPFDLERVKTIIRQALTARKMLELNPQDGVESDTDSHEPKLIGSSPVMQEVFKQIALTTTSDAPVLITGESGTGKELTARSIHRFGSRSSKPFVAVNIASLNPLLAESELFGHVKGAFTGADSDRKGLMEQANGGTLFLDEVAEIPLEIQVKLLRVLDLGEVTPVGSNRPIRTRFRLISATNQDLTTQINHGEFRHDLFYRLRTFEIHLPPLRDRKQDLKELVDHFLAHSTPQSSYTDEFLTEVLKRTWKGNVRELRSAIERAVTLARQGVLLPEHLQDSLDHHPAVRATDLEGKIQSLIQQWTRENWTDDSKPNLYESLIEMLDPAIVMQAFELSDGQYSAASRRLGIHRTTFKRKYDFAKPKTQTDFPDAF